ncbi:hypothetical protein [Leptolyngbya sp. 7M]|uniref:hypothetical protein n=1 Tax=Leptolyngbya sp. 7M TaxID=2812896 RepID=UPI001B8C596F|nr:hypothetical protein [Leptolyngbya sp. 7M]QYO68091.1 hypothetical protein JVX88_15750 [Leptolyngbya sp. 7M]
MSFQQSDQQAEKWAEIICSMLMHESEVMNHRITWLVTIQGLLFPYAKIQAHCFSESGCAGGDGNRI